MLSNKKLLILSFEQTIIRTRIQSIDKLSIQTMDDTSFMNTFFGEIEEDYRLFLTVMINIESDHILVIKSSIDSDIVLAIIKKYLSILKFETMIDKFTYNIFQDSKNTIRCIIKKFKLEISSDVILIDSNRSHITRAKKLGITTCFIDNNYRRPIGIYYNDFVYLQLLPMRASLDESNSKILCGFYTTNKANEIKTEPDIITFDTHSDHPFGTYALASKVNKKIWNNYNTDTLCKWINSNPSNPLTREKLSTSIINRINFYNQIQQLTPFITYLNTNEYFYTFMNNLQNGIYADDLSLHAFITVDLMLEFFTKTFGTVFSPRNKVNDILLNKPNGTWILRPSSLIGDSENFAFVISVCSETNIIHTAYILRKGHGICRVYADRGTVISEVDQKFNFKTLYEILLGYGWEKSIYFNSNT